MRHSKARLAKSRLALVWLTLFAFGAQLAIVALHYHPARANGIAARAITAGMCTPGQSRWCIPEIPATGDKDGCAICWTAAVAASSLTPTLPELPPPPAVEAAHFVVLDRTTVRQLHRDQFQARGPPQGIVG